MINGRRWELRGRDREHAAPASRCQSLGMQLVRPNGSRIPLQRWHLKPLPCYPAVDTTGPPPLLPSASPGHPALNPAPAAARRPSDKWSQTGRAAVQTRVWHRVQWSRRMCTWWTMCVDLSYVMQRYNMTSTQVRIQETHIGYEILIWATNWYLLNLEIISWRRLTLASLPRFVGFGKARWLWD